MKTAWCGPSTYLFSPKIPKRKRRAGGSGSLPCRLGQSELRSCAVCSKCNSWVALENDWSSLQCFSWLLSMAGGFLLLDHVWETYVLHRPILIRKSQCLKIQRLWYPAIAQTCVASIELHEYRYRLKEQESKRRRWQRSQADPMKDPREQARKTPAEEN
ncbi:hypothetical protein PoB_002157700 [Plakobranchus ocellatus]|uniref:Uncharacterized protein n=1 Tax=Plakobranchus ocellatus TaxID=259542 RepID=A0AAV3ZIC4_9GAST|nr:hypothetical protein PoB_002157700 [Plakobranchus ocellatus]